MTIYNHQGQIHPVERDGVYWWPNTTIKGTVRMFSCSRLRQPIGQFPSSAQHRDRDTCSSQQLVTLWRPIYFRNCLCMVEWTRFQALKSNRYSLVLSPVWAGSVLLPKPLSCCVDWSHPHPFLELLRALYWRMKATSNVAPDLRQTQSPVPCCPPVHLTCPTLLFSFLIRWPRPAPLNLPNAATP